MTLLIVLLCGLVPETRAAPGALGPPRRIVFILLDAARSDRFSAYGYSRPTTPAIDALAARGAVFLNHYSQGTDTRTSMPSLFYSRYVTLAHAPVASIQPIAPSELFLAPDRARISLPRVLRRAGYRTAAISAHLWLDEASTLMRDFDAPFDLSRRLGRASDLDPPSAETVVDAALAWIRRNDRAGKWFLYLHLLDTHFPHFPGPDARGFLGELSAPGSFSSRGFPRFPGIPLTPRERTWLDGLYDGSLRYADRQLKRLFEGLSKLGPGEETLVIVTADHGERLLEKPDSFGHGSQASETVVRVPLVISGAGVPAGRHTRFTEGVDVAPTVMELAQASLPEGAAVDGVSLRPAMARPELPGPANAVTRCAIRDRGFKLFVDDCDESLSPSNGFAPGRIRTRLYDLTADPLETTDVSTREPRAARELLTAYQSRVGPSYARFVASPSNRTPAFPFALSAATLGVHESRGDACNAGSTAQPFLPRWSPPVVEKGSHLTFDTGRPQWLRVDMPDGRYRLSIQVKGRGRVTVDGRSKEVSGPRDRYLGEPGRDVDLGSVEVRERRLCLMVDGAAREGLKVLRLGFVPGTLPVPDRGLDERLRALGYLGGVK